MSKSRVQEVIEKAHTEGLPLQTADKALTPAHLAQYNGVRIRDLTIDTPASEWPTSLDRSVPEQRAAIFNAGNPPDFRVEVGQTVNFTAHHWLMYLDEFEDEETGELRPGPVLVLFDKDGKMMKSTSQFAPRRLKAALELYGPADWQRGITFIVQDRPSKRPGRHYHDIRIVI